MLYKSDRPSEEAADKKYLTPMLIFHSHICYPAYIFSELTSVCFSTVESGVWLSMESPHRQVFSVGGIHLRIPGVWNPCRLVRVLFLHDSRRSSHIGGVKKKKKNVYLILFLFIFFLGLAATRCWSYRCCSCWCSVWPWPSPSMCPCSAPCASSRASAWQGSPSPSMSSVSVYPSSKSCVLG